MTPDGRQPSGATGRRRAERRADDGTAGEGAPAAVAGRRRRTGVLSGAVLAAAALAALVSLTVGPALPPSAAESGIVTTAPAPAAAALPAAAAPAPQGSAPLHITYPGIGMDQEILPLTPQDLGPQTTIVPPMTTDAYWLTPYGSPGSTDTTYIVGHSWEGLDPAFNRLSSQAKPGDRIVVATAAGPATYTVTTISTEDKYTLRDSPIWDRVPNRLIVVSCYTADLRGTNIIVTADLDPAP